MNEYKLTKRAKKAQKRERLESVASAFAIWFFAMLSASLLVGTVGLEIWAWVTYGNKPIGEIPAWVMYLLFK